MARLGDVCEKKIDTIKATYTGNIDYIDISSVDNQRKEITKTQSMLFEDAPSRAKQLVFPGDILVSTVRPNLNAVALITDNSDNILVASTGYCILRCLPNVDRKYVFYFCQSNAFIEKLVMQATGASYPAVTSTIVKECIIPLPSLDKQRQIAAVLDKVSDLIAKRRQQLDKLDLLVKSKFVEMFGDCKMNPKKWNICNLEEIAEVGSSKRVFVEELKETGIPFYRGTEVGALAEGKSITPELFITQEHYQELCQATGVPRKGDLLMPSICPDGRIWVVNSDEPFYFKDGRVLWVHNINERFNPIFLLYTLKDRIMTDYNSIASGTTFAELKIFSLKKCQIFDVSLELQNKFADFVEQKEKTKTSISQSLEKLETLKKALMQEYFG